ncbi:MAG: class I SAM-dependent methyltransferase [Acidimicrobiales bacterium]|jgi:SAM-dependent methyltransferase|nr:class I SAM-dependent methyltransferase [Acidimicrobiales bacterium]MDP6298857.1 class I SAM-dependent methyltransferase [Acidimicrobiales bacterium]HJM28676.1 class I SAM-dependent methyltransferase [Acidimicrobiales bacterium]HJM97011.1 class I SAM-dependent methyltransferase [Acidimicrobiales bacterium]
MLTVDYDRLLVEEGHEVLDLGCGFGRHAYESLRRGAKVVACDMALPELQEVRATYAAMLQAGEISDAAIAFACAGDATRLPFNDGTFDRIIASEVLEHIPDDDGALQELFRVLKPGGKIAITVPAFLPERICWTLSDEYHAPKEVGGHIRIYRKNELREKMESKGLKPIDYHRAHALHSPYWWLKCAVGTKNNNHPLVKLYLRFLTWDIVKQPWLTRILEKLLQPVLGKSAIIYAQKAATA